MTTRYQVKKLVADAIPSEWSVSVGHQITDIASQVPMVIVLMESGTLSGNMSRKDIAEVSISLIFIYNCEDEETEDAIDRAVNAVLDSPALRKEALSLYCASFSYEMDTFAPHMSYTAQLNLVYRVSHP
jgi:hypothetical protein